MYLGEVAEEDAIACHGVINARGRDDGPVRCTAHGNDDGDGHQPAGRRPQHCRDSFARHAVGSRDALRAQRREVGEVCQHIQHDENDRAKADGEG